MALSKTSAEPASQLGASIDLARAHETYRDLSALHTKTEAALVKRLEFAGGFAYIRSEVDGGPGVWETVDVVRTLTWHALVRDVPSAALGRWMLQASNADGGFPPWPDISSRSSYTEATARSLLSLLRLEEVVPELRTDLRRAALNAAKWLLQCQAPDEGGWGSAPGWTLRTSPTVWAILALGEMDRLGSPEDATARGEALRNGAAWLSETENPDGGYGLTPGAPSNLCSTSQAAWALGFRNELISARHQARLVEFLTSGERADVIDEIVDDPARKFFGRFELILLGHPLGLLGLMACRVGLRDHLVHALLLEIREDIGPDSLWRIPDGRGVWPSHFYLWAIRTWIEVYQSYARAGLTSPHARLVTTDTLTSHEKEQSGHVFLSHASSDKVFVRQISRILDASGWDTWLDERALVAGDDLVGGIGEGIKNSHAVVLVITSDFQGDAGWLSHEVTLAVKQQIDGPRALQIIPIVMADASEKIPEQVRHLVWKTADTQVDAIALILEALARGIGP